MQPYIFPYLGYFQLIHGVDKFVIYDDVNFINKGWINRNHILLSGKPFLFGIPLIEASQNRLINEIEIVNERGWRNKFLRTIEQAYRKAPYFEQTRSLVASIVNSDLNFIGQLALLSLKGISKYIGIQTEFVDSSSVYQNRGLKGQERILDICKKETSGHYINPIGGMEIYSADLFNRAGIKLNFIKSGPVEYKQFNNVFVPNLSIIDVLMFNSAESIKAMLELYELV